MGSKLKGIFGGDDDKDVKQAQQQEMMARLVFAHQRTHVG